MDLNFTTKNCILPNRKSDVGNLQVSSLGHLFQLPTNWHPASWLYLMKHVLQALLFSLMSADHLIKLLFSQLWNNFLKTQLRKILVSIYLITPKPYLQAWNITYNQLKSSEELNKIEKLISILWLFYENFYCKTKYYLIIVQSFGLYWSYIKQLINSLILSLMNY